jgi:hypothetical protein
MIQLTSEEYEALGSQIATLKPVFGYDRPTHKRIIGSIQFQQVNVEKAGLNDSIFAVPRGAPGNLGR